MLVVLLALVLLLSGCGDDEAARSEFDVAATKRCLERLDAVVVDYSSRGKQAQIGIDEPFAGNLLNATFGLGQGFEAFDSAFVALASSVEEAERFEPSLRRAAGQGLPFGDIRRRRDVITWGMGELRPKYERAVLGCVRRR